MVAQIEIPVPRFTKAAHKHQIAAMRAFDQGRARFAHLIWHRRGRKTSLALNLMIREALKHPRSTYRHILPKRTQAEEVVWNDPNMLFSYLPPRETGLWKANISNLTILFRNGSRIVLDGADKLADARRGIGGDGFVLDEWAFHENAYVYDGLIQPILTESKAKWCWFITTFNGVNHAYDMYYAAVTAKSPDTYTDMMRASESGVLPQIELDRSRKSMPNSMYLQEFECEPLTGDNSILIQPAHVERLKTIQHGFADVRRIVSIDPAFGGDACVLMFIENTKVVDKQILHPDRTEEIVGAGVVTGSRWNTRNFIVDEIGIGRGVADGLNAIDGNFVQSFNSSEKSDQTDPLLLNLRAEAWWYTSQEIREGRVAPIEDAETRKQLCGVLFKVAGSGAIQMEDKAQVRKRIGRSPDEADAYVMGQWGLRNTPPVRENDRWATSGGFVPAGAGMGGMG